nr:hypothetical protein [Tanacetum cinerariifolium]
MKAHVKDKLFINVSIGQCKRAKQRAVYDHEVDLEVETLDGGKTVIKRMYICFKAMKDGWSKAYRRVIRLDGCFLSSTYRYFNLCSGAYLTIISYGHKSLKEAVRDLLPYGFTKDKPIITMLEDIRTYLMQIMIVMNQKATSLVDPICPSIKKEIEKLKVKQRYWVVVVSEFQEFEVRKAGDGFGMNEVAKMTEAEKAAKESRQKDAERVIKQAKRMRVYKKRGVDRWKGPSERIKN